MDAVSNVSSQTQISNLVGDSDVLDRDAFLNLLVTQLQHQDPLDPMENTEFIAQLAQFSSLEQMQNVSSGISNLSGTMQSVNNSLATQLIGKDVKYLGDTFRLVEGSDANLSFYLEESATVKISIYDENDQLVGRVINGDVPSGNQTLTWAGKDLNGQQNPSGRYRFEIEATNSNGQTVNVATFGIDRVKGLKFDKGTAVLVLDGKELYLGDIVEIMESSLAPSSVQTGDSSDGGDDNRVNDSVDEPITDSTQEPAVDPFHDTVTNPASESRDKETKQP